MHIIENLKESAVGIIILGAIGSILGLFIIFILRKLLKKFLEWLIVEKWFYSIATKILITRVLLNQYRKNKDYFRFLMILHKATFECYLSSLLFLIFFFSTLVYVAHFGFKYSNGLLVLICITFISLFSLFHDAIRLLVFEKELTEEDQNSIKAKLSSLSKDKRDDLISYSLDILSKEDKSKTLKSGPTEGKSNDS